MPTFVAGGGFCVILENQDLIRKNDKILGLKSKNFCLLSWLQIVLEKFRYQNILGTQSIIICKVLLYCDGETILKLKERASLEIILNGLCTDFLCPPQLI